jgi:hypothetical protein
MTMKTIFIFGSLVTIAVLLSGSDLSSCQEQEDDISFILLQLQSDIWGCLNDLDIAVANASHQLSATGLDGVEARRVLQDLRSSSPYVTEAVTVGLDGKIIVAEPTIYSEAEGADINQQEHIIRLFETKNPILSGVFHTVEGYDAFVIVYPVFSPSGKFIGGISVPIKPAEMLENPISSKLNGTQYSVCLIQTDGLVLYDTDPRLIGRTLFKDSLFQPSEQLLVKEERSGWLSYAFLDDEYNETVTNEAYWTTVGIHGTEWRLLITRKMG